MSNSNNQTHTHPQNNGDLLNNRIPVSIIEDNPASYQASDLVIDATQHNSAVRLIKGKFQRLRRWLSTPLIMLFILAPWLTLNGNPALQMDLETRQLHLLGVNFWPDDLLILMWVAMASAFALFAVATFAGRLWCGFTCPQTVWSMMFVWVEEKIEGSRNQRLKQKNNILTVNTLTKSVMKHSIWLIMSFITGFTFVAFFETGAVLFENLISFNLQADIVFWLIFFTSLTYLNAGWLREQVCLHMCPYARFQSVMLDTKSLKVSYDHRRGEPRRQNTNSNTITNTAQSLTTAAPEASTGDCINCQLCVQVCPVGIDIRQGMQYACIDCGACIDACDDIMEKTHQPKGLIRFSNELNQHWTSLFKNRTRLLGYAALTMVCILGFALQVHYMETFDAQLNRDRSQLYFFSGEGKVQNAYLLNIHNKTNQQTHYSISINNPELNIQSKSKNNITVNARDRKNESLILSCDSPCVLKNRTAVELTLISDSPDRISNIRTLKAVFFAP